jgi:hypothetical protein
MGICMSGPIVDGNDIQSNENNNICYQQRRAIKIVEKCNTMYVNKYIPSVFKLMKQNGVTSCDVPIFDIHQPTGDIEFPLPGDIYKCKLIRLSDYDFNAIEKYQYLLDPEIVVKLCNSTYNNKNFFFKLSEPNYSRWGWCNKAINISVIKYIEPIATAPDIDIK